jgi:S1-C subfamily serine protease
LSVFGCTYSQNLINPEGQVITCSSWGWGCIGGPIAINTFNRCIETYQQLGYVEIEKVGVPGFYLSEESPPTVLRVQPGYPAEKVGIMAGDTIIAVNGQKISSRKDAYILGFCKAGDVVSYEILRKEEHKSFSLVTVPKLSKPQ